MWNGNDAARKTAIQIHPAPVNAMRNARSRQIPGAKASTRSIISGRWPNRRRRKVRKANSARMTSRIRSTAWPFANRKSETIAALAPVGHPNGPFRCTI
jgi:hypothetical protein